MRLFPACQAEASEQIHEEEERTASEESNPARKRRRRRRRESWVHLWQAINVTWRKRSKIVIVMTKVTWWVKSDRWLLGITNGYLEGRKKGGGKREKDCQLVSTQRETRQVSKVKESKAKDSPCDVWHWAFVCWGSVFFLCLFFLSSLFARGRKGSTCKGSLCLCLCLFRHRFRVPFDFQEWKERERGQRAIPPAGTQKWRRQFKGHTHHTHHSPAHHTTQVTKNSVTRWSNHLHYFSLLF